MQLSYSLSDEKDLHKGAVAAIKLQSPRPNMRQKSQNVDFIRVIANEQKIKPIRLAPSCSAKAFLMVDPTASSKAPVKAQHCVLKQLSLAFKLHAWYQHLLYILRAGSTISLIATWYSVWNILRHIIWKFTFLFRCICSEHILLLTRSHKWEWPASDLDLSWGSRDHYHFTYLLPGPHKERTLWSRLLKTGWQHHWKGGRAP